MCLQLLRKQSVKLNSTTKLTRRFASLFARDFLFVVLEFGVGHCVEGVLGVGRLVDGRVVLEPSLDDALGRSTHQDHLVTSLTDVGILTHTAEVM